MEQLLIYNNTVVRMIEKRQPSEMVITGSDLIAGHGGLQPVGEDADLKTTKETSVRAANKQALQYRLREWSGILLIVTLA